MRFSLSAILHMYYIIKNQNSRAKKNLMIFVTNFNNHIFKSGNSTSGNQKMDKYAYKT